MKGELILTFVDILKLKDSQVNPEIKAYILPNQLTSTNVTLSQFKGTFEKVEKLGRIDFS